MLIKSQDLNEIYDGVRTYKFSDQENQRVLLCP